MRSKNLVLFFFFANLHILTWIAWFLASEGLLDAFHNVCACRNYVIHGNRKIWGCQFSYITENHIWHIIICIKQYLDMAAIQEYCTRICFLSRNGVVRERKELFRNINDDAFFLIKSWPSDIKMIFGGNQKQTGDQGTFKLMLFAEGNGCSPDLMRTWILLSQAWNDAKTAEKRSKQIDFIVDNLEQKRASRFYIDINYGKLLLLNGQLKN